MGMGVKMEAKGVMGSVCTVLELCRRLSSTGIAQKVDSVDSEEKRNDATIRIVEERRGA